MGTNYTPLIADLFYTATKEISWTLLTMTIKLMFNIEAAGVVPCGGPKKSPRTSSIVQIVFSVGPLRSARTF